MRFRALAALLLSAVLAGCAASNIKILKNPQEDVSLSNYTHIGVAPFRDPRGKGIDIAEGIENGLQEMLYEPVSSKNLQKIFADLKADSDTEMGIELMETIRRQTSAELIIFGRISPRWDAVAITMIETNMGDTLVRALIQPPKKGEKAFGSTDEIVQQVLRLVTRLRS